MSNPITYTLLDNSNAVLRSDGAVIPEDSANIDWIEYQNWLSLGNTPTPVALTDLQTKQIAILTEAYQTAISSTVGYTTTGGVTQTYQADPVSLGNLQDSMLALQKTAATPAGFYWVAADNTQVPFTYADLQGLATAIYMQGWTAFQHLQTQKAAVRAATTAAAVQAVVW